MAIMAVNNVPKLKLFVQNMYIGLIGFIWPTHVHHNNN